MQILYDLLLERVFFFSHVAAQINTHTLQLDIIDNEIHSPSAYREYFLTPLMRSDLYTT